MSTRVVNLGFVFGALILFAFLASRLVAGGEARPVAHAPSSPRAVATPEAAAAPFSGAGWDMPASGSSDRDLRTYAVRVIELQGLPPTAAPGTVLDLWVAWEPPLTREPRFQLLLPRVVLERIVPAVTPEGPATALLRVSRRAVADLLYGDRYGAFSVTLVSPHAS